MDLSAAAAHPHQISDKQIQFRAIPVPPHRYTPLKQAWREIYTPIHDEMKIAIRMNLKASRVELKTRPDTAEAGNLQKSADFVRAFLLGFDVVDAAVMLRVDEVRVESFEAKTSNGEHLARAIARRSVRGLLKGKFEIESMTRTRIVIEHSKIHILGFSAHIKVAWKKLDSLIINLRYRKI